MRRFYQDELNSDEERKMRLDGNKELVDTFIRKQKVVKDKMTL